MPVSSYEILRLWNVKGTWRNKGWGLHSLRNGRDLTQIRKMCALCLEENLEYKNVMDLKLDEVEGGDG